MEVLRPRLPFSAAGATDDLTEVRFLARESFREASHLTMPLPPHVHDEAQGRADLIDEIEGTRTRARVASINASRGSRRDIASRLGPGRALVPDDGAVINVERAPRADFRAGTKLLEEVGLVQHDITREIADVGHEDDEIARVGDEEVAEIHDAGERGRVAGANPCKAVGRGRVIVAAL